MHAFIKRIGGRVYRFYDAKTLQIIINRETQKEAKMGNSRNFMCMATDRLSFTVSMPMIEFKLNHQLDMQTRTPHPLFVLVPIAASKIHWYAAM